jgi:iron complex transport system substrate-binding protein
MEMAGKVGWNLSKKQLFAVTAAVIIVVAALGAVLVLNGLGNDIEGDFTVTDMRGRTVSIKAEVDSIVCLSASSLRLISYFDAVDMVSGIDSFDAKAMGSPANYFKATYRIAYQNISSITSVGSEANFAEINATGADVIFSSIEDVGVLNDLQNKTNIAVVGLNAQGAFDIDDMEAFGQQLTLIGKVLGREARAQELIDGINGLLDELEGYRAEVPENQRKEAYVGGMFYFMQGGFYKTTGKYLPFDLTCAENVMPDMNNGNPYDTSLVDLMDADPDYIFVDSMTYASSSTAFQADEASLSNVTAVANQDIYTTLVYKYYGTNWETEIINAFYIGTVLNPEVYDYDMEDKANEILALFFPGSDVTYQDLLDMQSPGCGQVDWF